MQVFKKIIKSTPDIRQNAVIYLNKKKKKINRKNKKSKICLNQKVKKKGGEV